MKHVIDLENILDALTVFKKDKQNYSEAFGIPDHRWDEMKNQLDIVPKIMPEHVIGKLSKSQFYGQCIEAIMKTAKTDTERFFLLCFVAEYFAKVESTLEHTLGPIGDLQKMIDLLTDEE